MVSTELYPHAGFDRFDLPPGPWRDEPNQKSWLDQRHHLPCAMMRNKLGVWCGYVGVSHAHPAAGKQVGSSLTVTATYLEAVEERYVEIGRDLGWIDLLMMGDIEETREPNAVPLSILLPAHGGLTYSSAGNDGLWWFGFDCAHAGDLIPAKMTMNIDLPFMNDFVYRDHDYVYGCVTRLAWALAEVEQKNSLDNVAVKTASKFR